MPNSLRGFKVAVIATHGVEESEILEPLKALREAQADVKVLSTEPGEIQAVKHLEKGEKIPVDAVLDLGSADDFDGVVFPGGAVNADQLRVNSFVKKFVLSFQRIGKPIAFICHAPWILTSAGVAKGRTLTSYHTIMDDIVNAGGEWVDREVVRDGNWVSSRQPSDLPAFNREMLALFAEAYEDYFVSKTQLGERRGLEKASTAPTR